MRYGVARGVSMALTLGIAMSGLAACGGDDEDDAGRSVPRPLSEEFSVLGALAELPADADGLELDQAMISVADLDAATSAAGSERAVDGSQEAWVNWIGPLIGLRPSNVFVPLPEGLNTQATSPDEFAEVAGWSVLDVRSYAEISAPPYTFTVVQGVRPDALAPTLLDSGDGVRSSREGEDLAQDIANVSAVDRLGRPIRFLQRDDRIGFGTTTDLVTSWADGEPSLAQDDSWAAIAAALDDEKVVSAVLAVAPRGGIAGLGSRLTAAQQQEAAARLDGMLVEEPFDVIGIGWSADGEVHVAYHFADDDAAEASAKTLERAWRDGTSITSQQPMSELVEVEEVESDDDVVRVTIEPVDGRRTVPLQMLQTREFVLVSP